MSPFYRRATIGFGLLAIALGVALIVRTAADGGGSFGYTFGGLFVALGVGRLYLVRRR